MQPGGTAKTLLFPANCMTRRVMSSPPQPWQAEEPGVMTWGSFFIVSM